MSAGSLQIHCRLPSQLYRCRTPDQFALAFDAPKSPANDCRHRDVANCLAARGNSSASVQRYRTSIPDRGSANTIESQCVCRVRATLPNAPVRWSVHRKYGPLVARWYLYPHHSRRVRISTARNHARLLATGSAARHPDFFVSAARAPLASVGLQFAPRSHQQYRSDRHATTAPSSRHDTSDIDRTASRCGSPDQNALPHQPAAGNASVLDAQPPVSGHRTAQK